MKYFLLLIVTITIAFMRLVDVKAALKTKVVEYKHGDAVLEGYLAYDDTMQGKRPGVLVVHCFRGLRDFDKERAEQLAKLGYIAFAGEEGEVTFL